MFICWDFVWEIWKSLKLKKFVCGNKKDLKIDDVFYFGLLIKMFYLVNGMWDIKFVVLFWIFG